MNFSRNQYLLNGAHPAKEIAERLYDNTYQTDKLMRVRTKSAFIGEVDEEGFYLIGSSRMGGLCTLNGKFATDGQNTTIAIETRIHRAFIILFTCWAVIVAVLPMIFYITNPAGSGISIGMLPLILIAIAGARWVLHLAYSQARNNGIRKIEELIA
jgi:lipopolysaccharide export LptBFGC system permease protein LptF